MSDLQTYENYEDTKTGTYGSIYLWHRCSTIIVQWWVMSECRIQQWINNKMK